MKNKLSKDTKFFLAVFVAFSIICTCFYSVLMAQLNRIEIQDLEIKILRKENQSLRQNQRK